MKECQTGKYTQKLRQALAKVEESGRFIEAERRKVTLTLSDLKAVEAWETNIRTRGTPLTKFYESWKKVHQRQVAKQATDNVKVEFDPTEYSSNNRNTCNLNVKLRPRNKIISFYVMKTHIS